MKMKELSALTGISDRTIRYYIDDGLFVPEKYTENYEGRRSYEFTENDVKALSQIAVLRKNGFSINEIKALVKEEINIDELLCQKIAEANQNSKEQLAESRGLQHVKNCYPQNLQNLCDLLSSFELDDKPVAGISTKKKRFQVFGIALLLILISIPIVIMVGRMLIVKVYRPENETPYYQVIDRRISSTEIYELKELFENEKLSLQRFLLYYRPQCVRQPTDDTRYALLVGLEDEMVYVFWDVQTNAIINVFDVGYRYSTGYKYMENKDYDYVVAGETHYSEIAFNDKNLIWVGTNPIPKTAHITKEGVVIISYYADINGKNGFEGLSLGDYKVKEIKYYSNEEIPLLREETPMYYYIPYILPQDKP